MSLLSDTVTNQESDGFPRLRPPPTKAQVKAMDKSEIKPKTKQSSLPERPAASELQAPAVLSNPPIASDTEESQRTKKQMTHNGAVQEQKKNNDIDIGEPLNGDQPVNFTFLPQPLAAEPDPPSPQLLHPQQNTPNNFPPFLILCPHPFKPCCYVNIKTKIYPPERWKMRALWATLIYTWVCLGLNLIISIAGAVTTTEGYRQAEYLSTMAAAIIYLVLFVPCSLCCWFLPIYGPYRKNEDGSVSYLWFFFFMVPQVFFFFFNSIGLPNLGACGIFNASGFFNGSSSGATAVGALYMIMGILWFVGAILSIVMIVLMLIVVFKNVRQRSENLIST